MIYGIRFFLIDGTNICYDPVMSFTDSEDKYFIDNGWFMYEHYKKEVVRYEQYACCQDCGKELLDGRCYTYECEEVI